jgi:hypothetical protein
MPGILQRRNIAVEFDPDAERLGVGVEPAQQFQAADGGEAIAGNRNPRLVVHDGEVGPGLHQRRQQRIHVLVVGAQEFQRAVGEDHAEAPGRIARTALVDHDVVGGILPLHQGREIEARRPPRR